jgi:hypothetical protein
MIALTRQYIKDRIAAVFPAMKQIDDPIGNDDLSFPDLKYYKIIFGSASTENVGSSSWLDNIPVEIEIYNKSINSKEVEAFDEVYDNALRIRDALIDPLVAKNNASFNDILPNGISVEALNTNDKVFKATVNITVPRYFGCA